MTKLWATTFICLLAGPGLYWLAVVAFACRRCGRFGRLRRGLCYRCRNHLHRRGRM